MKKLRLLNVALILMIWLSLAGFAPLAQSHLDVSPIVPAATGPGAFDKVSPQNGAANQPAKGVTLTWNASSTSNVTYQVCLSPKPRCLGNNKKWQTVGKDTTWTTGALTSDTVYYWQVRALDSSNNTTEANNGTWWRFKTQPTAGPFGKISPVNTVDTPLPFTSGIQLTWGASANATGYEYCLYTGATNPCGSQNWTPVGNVTSITRYDLLADSVYNWEVRAVNGSSMVMADGGTYWQFKTEINQPSTFSKLSPENDPYSQPTQPVNLHLSWSPSTGATSYEYCVSEAPAKECPLGWTIVNDGNVISVGPLDLKFDTAYYWQVRAHNSQGYVYANGDTNWWSFKTMVSLPQTFSKISPLEGAHYQIRDPWLYWSPSDGATSYDYCVSQSNSTNCNIGNNWQPAGSGTSFQLHGLASSTTYYWRLRAKNSTGSVEADNGNWSSFTTMQAPPTSTDQSFSADEDALYNGHLTASASDLDFVVFEQDPPGLLDLNPDGSFTYMPPENYSGEITFQFTVWDGYNAPSDPYTATITVKPVNDPPVLIVPSMEYHVVSGDNISFTVTYTDPDIPYGDTLTFQTPMNLPADATFDTTTGDFIWDPSWSNTQSNTYDITFIVKDKAGATAQQTVRVTVDPLKVFLPITIR